MSKKLLLSLLLCFFVFSSGMVAGEKAKAKIIEHLVWADTDYGNIFYLQELDPTIVTTFESDPFLEFHVPASPKGDALFFEFWSKLTFKWSDYATRHAECGIWMRIISDDISDNIDVKYGWAVLRVHETNNSLDYDLPGQHYSERSKKAIMRRDSADWWKWLARYKDTGERVPEEVLVPIFNSLINNGFDVEVWAKGDVQGIRFFNYQNVVIEVTRLSKN